MTEEGKLKCSLYRVGLKHFCRGSGKIINLRKENYNRLLHSSEELGLIVHDYCLAKGILSFFIKHSRHQELEDIIRKNNNNLEIPNGRFKTFFNDYTIEFNVLENKIHNIKLY